MSTSEPQKLFKKKTVVQLQETPFSFGVLSLNDFFDEGGTPMVSFGDTVFLDIFSVHKSLERRIAEYKANLPLVQKYIPDRVD